MNIQALMKQAQTMQKEITQAKKEIDSMTFIGTQPLVEVTLNGNKTVNKIKIKTEELSKEDIEMLEDMILIATNDAINQIDKITEKKLGKYSNAMSGLM